MLAIPVVIATLLRSSSVTRLAPPPARADADPTRGVSPHHICARSGGGSFSLLPRCQQQARGAARAWHIIVMVPSKGTTASCSQQWQSYAVSPCEDATTRSGAARGGKPPSSSCSAATPPFGPESPSPSYPPLSCSPASVSAIGPGLPASPLAQLLNLCLSRQQEVRGKGGRRTSEAERKITPTRPTQERRGHGRRSAADSDLGRQTRLPAGRWIGHEVEKRPVNGKMRRRRQRRNCSRFAVANS